MPVADELEISRLLKLRAEARQLKDFNTADTILRDLRALGVDVNDRSMEWRSTGSEEVVESGASQSRDGADPTLSYTGPLELASILGEALLTQWRGSGRRRGMSFTHGFHPYKALMEPLCVAQLLSLLPGTGAIADPFMGSGTTVIETMLSGRQAIGSDFSPLAVGISKYHAWRPSTATIDEFRRAVANIVADLESIPAEASADQSIERLRAAVTAETRRCSAEIAGALLFLMSYEEAYVWPTWRKFRPFAWRIERTAQRYVAQLIALNEAVPKHTPLPIVAVADARTGPPLGEGCVLDGVLTSPPYPGVFTYLDVAQMDSNLMRHVATGADGVEIGSRAEKSAFENEGKSFADRWQRDTEAWLGAAAFKLRPGGRIAILIGDDSGVNCLDSVMRAAKSVSVANSDYELRVIASASITDRTTRPWAKRNGRGKGYRREHTILLEKKHANVTESAIRDNPA